jgi:hypothetical protein
MRLSKHNSTKLDKENTSIDPRLRKLFVTSFFYGEGLLTPRPTPQAGGPLLVISPRLLIQYIRS